MSARITAADVEIMTAPTASGGNIEARVAGVRRPFYVDRWHGIWLCTCGRWTERQDCIHMRAVKEAMKR